MRLRTQLALAFFLLAVVPLLGVTVYTYRRRSGPSAGPWPRRPRRSPREMSTRVEVVADELKERLQRMRRAPAPGQAETPFQKARREALVTAEKGELRLWLRCDPVDGRARRGGDPVRGRRRRPRLRARAGRREDAHRPRGRARPPGHPARRVGVGRSVPRRPGHGHRHRGRAAGRSRALRLPPHRRPQPRARPRARARRRPRHPAALAADDPPHRVAHRRARSGWPPATSTCACRCRTGASSAAWPRPSTAWPATCVRTRSG